MMMMQSLNRFGSVIEQTLQSSILRQIDKIILIFSWMDVQMNVGWFRGAEIFRKVFIEK